MPMVLRSRKSIHHSQDGLSEPAPRRRRSARLPGSTADEESDESENESVLTAAMEPRRGPPEEQQEEEEVEEMDEEEEEAEVTELKHCSVLLDRLQPDNKAATKELEEKDDMNRRGGKAVSRIPTFQKRPATVSQSTELHRKDAPVHGVEAPEKAASGSVGGFKSKPPDVREATLLPPPSIRVPKIGFDAPPPFIGTEQTTATAHSSIITAPKSYGLSESVQNPPMTVSPRPALRPQQASAQHFPEEDKRRSFGKEVDTLPDGPMPHPPLEGSTVPKPEEHTESSSTGAKHRTPPSASGDTPKPTEMLHITELSQEEAIMDEEPPWETAPMNTLEIKDSRSSSDADGEDDLAGEMSDGHDSEEHLRPPVSQLDVSNLAEQIADVDKMTSTVVPEKIPTEISAKSAERSRYSSFALFFLLPTTLLLLGGFGQHVWRYGLPVSVAQLTAHLELHFLEGFGVIHEPCSTDCRVHLVESVPEGLYQSSPVPSRRSTADSWSRLLHDAHTSVHIAAFYLTLRGSDVESAGSSDAQGRMVFEQLKQLESKGVKLQIAVNAPQTSIQDTGELATAGAEVREVDLEAVTGGIVHTKLWVVDQKHFYVGSANMDWRSLTQVREVGLTVENCSCLAQDAYRIFGTYWTMGGVEDGSLPLYWPARLSALSSSHNPMQLKFNGVPAQVYLSSAPPQISARGRSDDLAAILSVIDDAHRFIYISVMDYLPLSEFTEPLRFWPAIDDALRAAACTRRVQLRLLVSCWQHSPARMFTFLQSLLVLSRPPLDCHISIKIFRVPSTAEQMKIPFARVNHAKYMVTDRVVYIGTSNWSENYFTQTSGVGVVVNQTGSEVKEGQETLQSQAEELFLRDWTSVYAHALSMDAADACPRRPH